VHVASWGRRGWMRTQSLIIHLSFIPEASMQIPTFHHPDIALFQSALHETLARHDAAATDMLSVAQHPMMQALATAGAAFTQPGHTSSDVDIVVAELKCAGLVIQYLLATGRQKELLYDEITGSICDVRWAEALALYLALKASGKAVRYLPFDPTARPNPPQVLASDTVSIALLADWGMGTSLAENVLAQAVTALPANDPPVQQAPASILVHMGDIYYAGTTAECKRHFVGTVLSAVPNAFTADFPVYAIPGNHEYYSGAVGFYETVLPRLAGQTNSFFCLRTGQWQVVALDTGFHDTDPLTVGSNTTQLTDDQVAWLQEVMSTAGNRRTILLTHHQLNSGNSAVGTGKVDGRHVSYGINPLLLAQLKPYFGQIAVWLWGHEHNTVVFSPQVGLPLGRCIGSASIPMQVDMQPYATDPSLVGVDGIAVPAMDLSVQLSNNGTDYSHGFAVLSLSPAEATVNYYEVPLPASGQAGPSQASWLFGESFPATPPA
jgi:hypothetical protein